jgi:hypothetical protein
MPARVRERNHAMRCEKAQPKIASAGKRPRGATPRYDRLLKSSASTFTSVTPADLRQIDDLGHFGGNHPRRLLSI